MAMNSLALYCIHALPANPMFVDAGKTARLFKTLHSDQKALMKDTLIRCFVHRKSSDIFEICPECLAKVDSPDDWVEILTTAFHCVLCNRDFKNEDGK
jgi:hypothetical protein